MIAPNPKKLKDQWAWYVYFVIYLAIVLSNTVYFFSWKNQIFWYYQVLMAVDIWFLYPYLLNALAIILNIVTLIPLALLIRGIYILSPRFWGYFMFLRILLEFFGKSFEIKFLQSLFYQDRVAVWASLGMLITLTLPSYIGLFLYAFRRNPVPKDS